MVQPPFSFFCTIFFSVCSMTMILYDFSLKPYCTHFGKIWWYLVWTQSYWSWFNTHFKNKCNFWSNPRKMEITLFLLQCMVKGTKLCFNIHSNNTDWMTYQLFWSDFTTRNYDMLNFSECCTFWETENRPIVFIRPKYLYLP